MGSPVSKPLGGWCIDSLAKYVAEIVAKESGNVLGDNQHTMVVSRLKKRLIDLGNITPEEYYQQLNSNYEKESLHLVSILTTHHTFFFREFCHFEYLLNNLSDIVEQVRSRGESKIKVLSAACSRGQEVYSLAMFFEVHLKAYPGISYEILGTDIDPESVKVGKNGVYPYNEVKSIPKIYLSGNWQRGTGDISRFAKVKNHLKEKCNFSVMNLLDPKKIIGNNKYDIIFCRNVFIYFDQKSIYEIVKNFKNHLTTNGYLITGLSESLKSIEIPKNTHAPSIYSFDIKEIIEDPIESKLVDIKDQPKKVAPTIQLIPNPIRILNVDDSSSVLKLLGKIFNSDPSFQVVGTATNGLEAQEFLKNNKVDAMTLDIHMPEMDGVEYLKKNFKKGHPHVVVVSSASREDTRYAQQTIKYGACDFVEKPALNNLNERAEEIKNKIKMAFLNTSNDLSFDNSFKTDFKIKNCDQKARIFFSSFSDLKKVSLTLKELTADQPPIFIFFEGNNNYLDVIKDKLDSSSNIEVFEENTIIDKNKIFICDFSQQFDKIEQAIRGWKTSISVFGICSKNAEKKILAIENFQLLLEDVPEINKELKEVATDVFPWTSFPHIGTEFLADD